jgi:hypothetical protein
MAKRIARMGAGTIKDIMINSLGSAGTLFACVGYYKINRKL